MTAVLDPVLEQDASTGRAHVHIYDVESSWIPEGTVALCGHVNETAGRATLSNGATPNLCPPCEQISSLNGLFYGGGA